VNRLRNKLILIFLVATLAPFSAILWLSMALLEQSLSYITTDDLNNVSNSLESVTREFYRQSRENLKAEVASGSLEPQRFSADSLAEWPDGLKRFWESKDADRFQLSEPEGDRLNYLVRRDSEVWLYSRSLGGIRMEEVTSQLRQARSRIDDIERSDLYRGIAYLLILVSIAVWILSLAGILFLANRISRPIQELTAGLFRLAEGHFETRLHSEQDNEIGRAIRAFNHTAGHLQQNRDRLVYLTQVASWQMLARKMAHELKNSLTPIRLTVEEILARQPAADQGFLKQAAQVVIEEVEALERRVRAFSEFAAEPPAHPEALDINAMVRERVQFLSVAHPEVSYEIQPEAGIPAAWADSDQIKGILTNLLENAADAAGPGGKILVTTGMDQDKIVMEVHDSGPGLSEEARSSLFEPSITFKKHGMGLGLSISRKNALLSGGDLESIEGRLSGAGFRLKVMKAN